jgi:hypothetical protein
LIVCFVGGNIIVENDGEKQNHRSKDGDEERAEKLFQTRFSVNVFIIATQLIECNPHNRNKAKPINVMRVGQDVISQFWINQIIRINEVVAYEEK